MIITALKKSNGRFCDDRKENPKMRGSTRLITALAEAAGITIDGPAPTDIRVCNSHFFDRVLTDGSLGLGESYMDGWWTCENLAGFFCKLLVADIKSKIKLSVGAKVGILRAKAINLQSISRSREVAKVHYDLGNEFFEPWLDRRMTYSCGYWKNAKTLDDAQENKLELICRKLGLRRGHRVLDIGCGWGSFVSYAAERYGCQCVGVTIAERQAEYAAQKCAGLPVRIHVCDYRKIPAEREKFDRVVSIGMFEHVGPDNYCQFFETVNHVMTNQGLALLHTMGDNISRKCCDPWLNKYIFPNGVAPSIQQIGRSIEGRFVVEDWHNFGPDYFRTFMCWYDRFKQTWKPGLARSAMEPDRFYRMWEYYLNAFAGTFKVRGLHVWQLVLSKQGCVDSYDSVR